MTLQPRNFKERTTLEENAAWRENVGAENELHFRKWAAEVHTPTSGEISSDFTLADLDDQDKEGIRDMTGTAQMARNFLRKPLFVGECIWEWDPEQHNWYQRDLNIKEKAKVELIANQTWNVYMNRPIMTAILNRNKSGNFLVKGVLNQNEEISRNNEPHTTLGRIMQPNKEEDIKKIEKQMQRP